MLNDDLEFTLETNNSEPLTGADQTPDSVVQEFQFKHNTHGEEIQEIEEDSGINEAVQKTRIEADKVINNNGRITTQNNYLTSERNLFYDPYSLEAKYKNLVISKQELDLYINLLIEKRILILRTPDEDLVNSLIYNISLSDSFKNLEWNSIDFDGGNLTYNIQKQQGQEIRQSEFADYGMQIFNNTNLKNHKNKVWVVNPEKSSFIRNCVGRKVHNKTKSAIKHLKDFNSYSIWIVSDEDNNVELNELWGKFSQAFNRYFPVWEIDFLPSFLHHHFNGNGEEQDEEQEANYMLKMIMTQKALWVTNSEMDDLYEILSQRISGGVNALRNKVIEYANELKQYSDTQTGISVIKEKKRLTAEGQVKEANKVEKVVLYICAVLEPLSLEDFQVISEILLQGVVIDDHVYENQLEDEKTSGDLLRKILDLDLDISSKDLKKILNHDEINNFSTKNRNDKDLREKISGISYYKKYSRRIFERFQLETYKGKEGRQVIGFIDSNIKEEIGKYFKAKDPDYFQSQFNRIVGLANYSLIDPFKFSDNLIEALVRFLCRVAQTNPAHYGQSLLLPMFHQVIDLAPHTLEERSEIIKSKEEELGIVLIDNFLTNANDIGQLGNQLVNEITINRLIFFFEEFFNSGSRELQKSVYNILDTAISLTQRIPEISILAINLIKKTRQFEEIDTLEFLKKND